jgi:FAD/FMN-containing dehydrogenase
LVAIVRQAAAGHRSVRVGRRAVPGAVTIDLAHYDRLLRVDREAGSATVEAGISLRALSLALGSWGLSLENGGGHPAQLFGAAVSIGAHGTGVGYGGLATQVTAMRLVTPDGSVIACSADTEPEVFDAARVGLGALGVISTITLRCRPGFNLRVVTETVDIDRALAEFDTVADAHDHVELEWAAGRDTAKVTTADRTEAPADGGAVDRGYRWFIRRRKRRPLVEYSWARQAAGPALRQAQEETAGRRRGPHFPIVVSLTAGDDIPLSPAQGRPSVYIAGVAGLDGGRPQWGSGVRPDEVAAQYPRFGDWEAVRDRLDPQRRFAQTNGQG